jgi:hypothetical protein
MCTGNSLRWGCLWCARKAADVFTSCGRHARRSQRCACLSSSVLLPYRNLMMYTLYFCKSNSRVYFVFMFIINYYSSREFTLVQVDILTRKHQHHNILLFSWRQKNAFLAQVSREISIYYHKIAWEKAHLIKSDLNILFYRVKTYPNIPKTKNSNEFN